MLQVGPEDNVHYQPLLEQLDEIQKEGKAFACLMPTMGTARGSERAACCVERLVHARQTEAGSSCETDRQ